MQEVIVTTAIKLTEALHEDVVATLTKKFGLKEKSYNLKEVVDPSILGGIQINISSKQYDASVRGKLDRLQA